MKATNLIQLSLFDANQKQQMQQTNIADFCKNCQNCYQHDYTYNFYCNKQTGINTAYGHKKIRANDVACINFKALPKVVLRWQGQYVGNEPITYKNTKLVPIDKAKVFKNKNSAARYNYLLDFKCEIVLI